MEAVTRFWIRFDSKTPSFTIRVTDPEEDGWFEVPEWVAHEAWNYAHAMENRVHKAEEAQ